MGVRGSVQQVLDGRLLFTTDRVPSDPAQGCGRRVDYCELGALLSEAPRPATSSRSRVNIDRSRALSVGSITRRTRLMRSHGCQRRAPAAVDCCSRGPRDESRTGCLLLSERLEGELLAANTGLDHEAPLTGGEDRHAFLVFGVGRRVLRSRHRACLSRER
jgi:hypothetical protein